MDRNQISFALLCFLILIFIVSFVWDTNVYKALDEYGNLQAGLVYLVVGV